MREGGGYCNLVGRTNDAAEHPTITKNYPAHSVSGAKVEKPGYLLLLFLSLLLLLISFIFCYIIKKVLFWTEAFRQTLSRKPVSELISKT